jgi:hypothetical protein
MDYTLITQASNWSKDFELQNRITITIPVLMELELEQNYDFIFWMRKKLDYDTEILLHFTMSYVYQFRGFLCIKFLR